MLNGSKKAVGKHYLCATKVIEMANNRFFCVLLVAAAVSAVASCTREELPTRSARPSADSVGFGLRITVEGGGAWADTLEYRP